MNISSAILLSKAIGTIAPLLLLVLFGIAVYRTGSVHVVLAKMWRLIAGKSAISDAAIEKYIGEQHSLNVFSFFSGIKPKTLAQARRTIDWANDLDLDLRQVARCGKYFDLNALRVKEEALPSQRRSKAVMTAMWASLTIIFALSFWGTTTSYAYMSFKDDGRLFKLRENSAQALVSEVPLTTDSCRVITSKNVVLAGSGFSRSQTQTLCAFLGSKGAGTEVEEYLASQKLSVVLLALVFAIPFMMLVWWLATVANARKLHDELTRPVEVDNVSAAANLEGPEATLKREDPALVYGSAG